MKKLNQNQIVSNLKKEGLVFSNFTLTHEGNYTVSDADWNYKDIPHLHYIHNLVEAHPTIIAEDLITSINVQKVLGFKIPLCVINYQSGKDEQTYYTTWLFFSLIVKTSYEELAPIRTKVSTTYHIGSPKLLKWCSPIIKFLIKRNYKDLMSGDTPMRERRGQLRKWGYKFYKDGESYSFPFTAEILRDNVIAPDTSADEISKKIIISDVLPHDGEYFAGKDNHHGIRLVRKGMFLSLLPRMCMHEGASLDKEKCSEDMQLKCPWHGRKNGPLATFKLNESKIQKITFNNIMYSLDGDELTISKG